jgi:hypothetical protein
VSQHLRSRIFQNGVYPCKVDTMLARGLTACTSEVAQKLYRDWRPFVRQKVKSVLGSWPNNRVSHSRTVSGEGRRGMGRWAWFVLIQHHPLQHDRVERNRKTMGLNGTSFDLLDTSFLEDHWLPFVSQQCCTLKCKKITVTTIKSYSLTT